jgi:2'-5' RNA ligase
MTFTIVNRNSGLTSNSWTEIVSVVGKGAVRGISWHDRKNTSSPDSIKLVIDNLTVFQASGVAPSGWAEWHLTMSALRNEYVSTADEAVLAEQRLPFHHSFTVSYKRATATSSLSGLDVTVLYELRG